VEKRTAATDYHERTKHRFDRYARSPGYLDWDTQPDPFRRFRDAELTRLPLLQYDPPALYDDLFEPGAVASEPMTLPAVASFFELSLAVSAWKEFQGSRWALRINPSSGNLHPTEGYLVAPAIEGLADHPGVYHYATKEHGLERRTAIPSKTWERLVEGFPEGTFFVGLSSIHWREAWKYGERAYRYCQHDVGHALAAVSLSAALHGWQARWLDGMSDGEVARLLGLDRIGDFKGAEREHPDLLMAIVPLARVGRLPNRVAGDVITEIAGGNWWGGANQLSSDHVEWAIIDDVAQACEKPPTEPRSWPKSLPNCSGIARSASEAAPAARIIRRRRSAVAMDAWTSVTSERFYRMLAQVMPRPDGPPWSTLGPSVAVHLALFVHRVEDLVPGLYFLVRSPEEKDRLQESMRRDFVWEKPADCPRSLPLYLLMKGDARRVAAQLSCHQAIAGDGAFSVGMIAEFEPMLERYGPWFYRRLFWETGVIGQVLYLEAEAANVRGTGIGCFFDDSVHEVLGLSGKCYQSLYHFTVGGPIEDTRLLTLPPYAADGG
jgi:SagB-type dehydrogenase family enzyme